MTIAHNISNLPWFVQQSHVKAVHTHVQSHTHTDGQVLYINSVIGTSGGADIR